MSIALIPSTTIARPGLRAPTHPTPAAAPHGRSQVSELARREVLAYESGDRHVLVCLSGRMWITVEGCTDDILLERGEAFEQPSGRRMVVQALQDTRLRNLFTPRG